MLPRKVNNFRVAYITNKDHCNDASKMVKKSGEDMKVEKDEK